MCCFWKNVHIASPFLVYYIVPYAPCTVYLPTWLWFWARANVGKHIPALWFAYGCSSLLWYWHQSSSKIPRTIPWDPQKCQQIPILCLVDIPKPLWKMMEWVVRQLGWMEFPMVPVIQSIPIMFKSPPSRYGIYWIYSYLSLNIVNHH